MVMIPLEKVEKESRINAFRFEPLWKKGDDMQNVGVRPLYVNTIQERVSQPDFVI